jgi:DNA-binding CsgD family transcriptional regulator
MLMGMLTPVQIEILEHIAEGKSNRQIARAMSYSEQAIKYHVTWILRKLDVKSRAHAVAAAIQYGLVYPDTAGNRRLIVEGLADLRNRSDESLYIELMQQIVALKDEVCRLADQLRDKVKPVASESSDEPFVDRSNYSNLPTQT